MITRLYTRNAPQLAVGIEVYHLTIHLPGQTNHMGDITSTGDIWVVHFSGDRADKVVFAPDAFDVYGENDLHEGDQAPAPGQTLEAFLEAEHQYMTDQGWVLLPHDFGVSETASRIIARSYELAQHATR
ncbi:hypothetical protein ACIA8R_29535 [Nonomuraea sp. NPDC051191]|uniref:hypothetical protein n=1 Tax=Nonomuraea sp. NPDC051191 TaxID=3364372 RepID=UPI00378C79B4